MRAIAFYLPQFHVIPENEAVYGPGFTEWDNVDRATPLFTGHYQPHVPARPLGHYSLLDPRAVQLQHSMALEFGVDGFCYYYYNFGGKRLLEQPLDLICRLPLKNSFCLCWDHNSWYDNKGTTRDIFLQQIYSEESARLLAKDLFQYFSHPRYIHIEGKPLFLIFAPERHPEILKYCEILRETSARMGIPELLLAGVEAFRGTPPDKLGLDIMVEFAPGWRVEDTLSAPDEEPRRLDYRGTIRAHLAKAVPDYTRLRCIFPSWDNTPRRGRKGLACVNIDPSLYQVALEGLVEYTKLILPEQFHFIFINGWNEWGEGCHLEPDEKYGFAWLEATKRALRFSPSIVTSGGN